MASFPARPTHVLLTALASLAGAALAAGCAEDPKYLEPPEGALEGGLVDADGAPLRAAATLRIPIKEETAEDLAERQALAAELSAAAGEEIQVPYVRLGDLEISVEWSLENQENRAGKVKVSLNGGNEYYFYDPSTFELGEGDEESPEPPALLGNIPLDVPPMGRISGVFREDQLAELSFDLDQITRGNVNPFRAVLQIDEDAKQFQPMTPADPEGMVPQMPMGAAIPREAIALVVRVDIALESNVRALLSYSVRVRDVRGLLHKYLMAAPVSALAPFEPAMWAPP
jgi:hypothetical protein